MPSKSATVMDISIYDAPVKKLSYRCVAHLFQSSLQNKTRMLCKRVYKEVFISNCHTRL
jgi:hypothetical protein